MLGFTRATRNLVVSYTARTPLLGQVTEPQSMRLEEIELAWGAKAGASTALVGLERGRDAYLEAMGAFEFAKQVRVKLPFQFYSCKQQL